MWLMDANGTCPGYCVALDIDYGQFTGRVKKLIASTVVKVRALRKVTPSKPRGRPRKAATKRARA